MRTMNARSGVRKGRPQGASPTTGLRAWTGRFANARIRRPAQARRNHQARLFAIASAANRSIADVTLNSESRRRPPATAAASRFVHEAFSFTEDCELRGTRLYSGGCRFRIAKRAADVAAMLANNSRQDRVYTAPGRRCQTSQRRAHYLIEYCLISNDQLLGCSLPVLHAHISPDRISESKHPACISDPPYFQDGHDRTG